MNNQLCRWHKLVCLLAVCLGWTACSSDLALESDLQGQDYVLTVDASKGGAATRGLTNSLQAVWSTNDRVTVLNASGDAIGTMTPLTTGSAKTKLKASLTSAVQLNDALTLVFPRQTRDYTGQVGSLDDIACKYDYATASVKVRYVEDGIVSATNATFENQQAIVKFSLFSGSSPIQATSLTISAVGLKQNATTTGDLTITPAAATSEFYAALSGVNGVVSLTATAGDKTYTYTTATSQTFADGGYYPLTVKMKRENDPQGSYLTLEGAANDGNSVVWVQNYGTLEYRVDDGDWATYADQQVSLAKGQKISFRGSDATSTSSSSHMQICCDNLCYIYGNIMSLLDKDNYATLTTLPYDDTFAELFKDNEWITHADGKDLVLPATKLRKDCYFQMFYGCTRLNHIVCRATDVSAGNCTYEWMYNVAEKGTFVKASSTAWPEGKNGIPDGWTVISE